MWPWDHVAMGPCDHVSMVLRAALVEHFATFPNSLAAPRRKLAQPRKSSLNEHMDTWPHEHMSSSGYIRAPFSGRSVQWHRGPNTKTPLWRAALARDTSEVSPYGY